MKNRMAVSRCCCEPVIIPPEPEAAWRTDWSNLENGTGTIVGLISVATEPEVNFEPVGFVKSSLGWTWPFVVGEVPMSLATAVMRFTGFVTLLGSPTEVTIDIGIYAGKWAGGADVDISDLFGPVIWNQPGGDPWGVGGSERVTDDIASIINALTSDAGWNHATDQVAIFIRSMTEQAVLDPIRQLDNTGPALAARLEYTV